MICESKDKLLSEWVYPWVKNSFKVNGFIISSNPSHVGSPLTNKHYWWIVRDNKWKDINFHYEMLFEGELWEASEISLEAHLERKTNLDETQINKIKAIFNVTTLPHTDKDPLERVSIKCDFTSIKNAEKSIEKIIDVLNKGSFVKYSLLANNALDALH